MFWIDLDYTWSVYACTMLSNSEAVMILPMPVGARPASIVKHALAIHTRVYNIHLELRNVTETQGLT